MVKEDLIKRKLKTDFQRYVFKAIPQGFSSTKAKRYRAHGCREKDCTFIENCAGRKDMFSKLPASA
jgi:hypothetical protein